MYNFWGKVFSGQEMETLVWLKNLTKVSWGFIKKKKKKKKKNLYLCSDLNFS